MQKRPFVLLEVLIALAILSLVLVPLISSPLRLFKKRQGALVELAQKRQAAVIFYRLLQKFKTNHPEWKFSSVGPAKDEKLPLPFPFEFEIEKIGKITGPFHYHLCYNKRIPGDIWNLNQCILYCTVCFKKECNFNRDRSEKEGFQILVARPFNRDAQWNQ